MKVELPGVESLVHKTDILKMMPTCCISLVSRLFISTCEYVVGCHRYLKIKATLWAARIRIHIARYFIILFILSVFQSLSEVMVEWCLFTKIYAYSVSFVSE